MHVLHLNASTKYICKKLNETFYKGILLDCPKCQLTAASFIDTLPAFLTKMVNKEKTIFPYMYYGDRELNRQWWIGLDRDSASALCKELVQRSRENGIKATCVD